MQMSGNCVSMSDFVKKKRSVYNPNLTEKEVEILMSLPSEYQGFHKVFDDDSLVEYIKGQQRFVILDAKGTDKFTIYQSIQTDSIKNSKLDFSPISMNVELDVAVFRMFEGMKAQ
jgi:hypothetical protein